MQSKDGKWFTRKKGAMLLLSLCLVGAAAVTTYYAMDLSEERAEEELIDLNQGIDEASAETEAEAVLAPEAQADFSDVTEMDVDPASLMQDEKLAADAGDAVGSDLSAEADLSEGTEPETDTQDSTEESNAKDTEENAADALSDGVEEQLQPTVSFAATEVLQWPVAGSVLMDYSMDATVYFATLDQYKYNPALILSAEEGTQVVAAAKGIVDSIATNEETGTTICMNLGDGYQLIYGQLKEVAVAEGDVVEAGQLLGYVSQPTKYYCEEGTNLYFAMEKDGVAEDPFLYLE